VAGKISWYQQLDFQSLAMEFSGGKLKQKGFFHSVLACHGFSIQLEGSARM
jgi:hypothetical protein